MNPNWKGGRRDHSDGYIMRYYPDHPRAKGNNGYVYEHILIMEDYLGRYVTREEAVHHINEKKNDNRIENLELLLNSEHTSYHKLDNHKDTSDRVCFSCGSDKTYIKQPYGHNKTPYPFWRHLYWDKVNWYCHKCYDREMSKR